MSDKLENLMYEAGLLADGCWEEMDEYDKKAIERFAELIVRECAGICDAYGMPDGTSQTAMVLSRAIKKHFGVKE